MLYSTDEDGVYHARMAPRLHASVPDRVRLAWLDRRERRYRAAPGVMTELLDQLARAEPRPDATMTGDEE